MDSRKLLGWGFLMAIAAYFPLFLHLDLPNLYLWDESRNAIHAYEMSHNGNFFVRYFMGNPDTWETKPPLLIWCQVFFLKTVGYNELAIRLPAALASLTMLVLILRFFYKELNNWYAGIASVMVLITSMGFIRGHVARTGDHDALLLLFLVSSMLFYYKYLKNYERKYALLFALTLSAAVLTKSIAGLFFLPGLFFYTLYKKSVIKVFTTKTTYWIFGIFALLVGGYYGIAESMHPGYLELIWDNELFPRFFNSSDKYEYNEYSRMFYTNELQREQFSFYLWMVPLASLLLLFVLKIKEEERDFAFLLFFTGASFLFTISMGSGNSWYSAPLIPVLSMLVGLFIVKIIEAISSQIDFKKNWLKEAFILACFASIFFVPYQTILNEVVYFPKIHGDYERFGGAIKKVEKDFPNEKKFWVYHSVANAQFHFYQYLYNEKKGYEIENCGVTTLDNCARELEVGEKVLVCETYLLRQVRARYLLKDLAGHEGCMFFEILGNIEKEKSIQLEK